MNEFIQAKLNEGLTLDEIKADFNEEMRAREKEAKEAKRKKEQEAWAKVEDALAEYVRVCNPTAFKGMSNENILKRFKEMPYISSWFKF